MSRHRFCNMGHSTLLLLAVANIAQIIKASPTPRHISREADAAAGLQIAQHVVELRQTPGTAPSSRYLSAERQTQISEASPAAVKFLSHGAGYGVDITFGRETFTLIFDTGSSDMWLPTKEFVCVGPDMKRVPVTMCGIGQTCDSGFSGGKIPDVNFNITYGHGEFVVGSMGYESVTVGGVTVPKQEAALVNYGFWMGDKATSGLMGWSFPTLTSAYPGTDPSKDNRKITGVKNYNPFIFNAIEQAGVNPMFGYAFSKRTESQDNQVGGQLSIGGVPNVAHGAWTSTPIKIMALSPKAPPEASQKYTFYTVIPDGFAIAKPPNESKRDTDAANSAYSDAASSAAMPAYPNSEPMIVDSGTTVSYLPRDIAMKYASMTKPAARWNKQGHLYQVPCNAWVPNLSVRIAGQDLWYNREDLLLTGELGQDPYDKNYCNLGVQPAPGPPFVLGGTFLRAVVTVHDLGQHKMWFAQRQ